MKPKSYKKIKEGIAEEVGVHLYKFNIIKCDPIANLGQKSWKEFNVGLKSNYEKIRVWKYKLAKIKKSDQN